MTRSISQLLFLLTLAFSSTLFGQGRIDSDPILHDIWWRTYKIDNDTNLTCIINSTINQNNLTKVVAHYSKGDSIYKIVHLTTISGGTQMTSFYFKDSHPIFISVSKNNYRLSADKGLFYKAVNSFIDLVDTNHIQQKQLYKNFYKAEYFFYQNNIRYANVMAENAIRVDNKKDKNDGLKLYHQWKELLMTKQ
jgi:hypothetical protein